MNTIIMQIIEADKKARLEVSSAKEKLNQLSSTLCKQDDLKDYYEKSLCDVLEAKKRELEAIYEEDVRNEELCYLNAIEKLDSDFASNREQWISKIVKECFDI